jgi:hypothetical protein
VGQEESIAVVADLLRARNAIDTGLARIVQRPMASGHLGEWLASRIFDIELEQVAVTPAFDGRFRSGCLQGKTVNIKWYLKREGLLDLTESPILDYYLVMTGPSSAAVSSKGTVRPWCIEAVYLFDAHQLHAEQHARGVKLGIASSVRQQQWAAAEIYSTTTNLLTPRQVDLLKLFRPDPPVAVLP